MRSLQDDQSVFSPRHHQVQRTQARLGCVLLEPPGCASDQICDAIAFSPQVVRPAAQAAGRYVSFFASTAHAIRAALLAEATTILLVCRPRSTMRSINCVIRLSRRAR